MVLEKTLESPLDCKEIQPVHSEGNQSWVFFGRNDAKAETPVLWPGVGDGRSKHALSTSLGACLQSCSPHSNPMGMLIISPILQKGKLRCMEINDLHQITQLENTVPRVKGS